MMENRDELNAWRTRLYDDEHDDQSGRFIIIPRKKKSAFQEITIVASSSASHHNSTANRFKQTRPTNDVSPINVIISRRALNSTKGPGKINISLVVSLSLDDE